MDYILQRLKEKTTWLGFLALVSAFGVAIKPELAESIATTGMSIAGLIMVIVKEEKKK